MWNDFPVLICPFHCMYLIILLITGFNTDILTHYYKKQMLERHDTVDVGLTSL